MVAPYKYVIGQKVCPKIEAKNGVVDLHTVNRIEIALEYSEDAVYESKQSVLYRLSNGLWYKEEELTNEHEALGMAKRFYLFKFEEYKKMEEDVWKQIESERWKRIKKMEEDNCGNC